MKFFNRIIPWLAALIVFVLLEQVLKAPKQVYWLATSLLLFIILAIWQLSGRQIRTKKFWQLVIIPTLFLASGVLFLSFLEGNLFKQIFLIGLVILVWIFLEVIFLRFHLSPKYQAHSLENISTHLSLLTVFLVASSFFSLRIFLGVPLWLLIISFGFILALATYQLIWSSDTKLVTSWPYIGVITIVATEIFWAVSFLPTSVYVNGLVVTVSYYLMTGLARNWLLGIQEGKVIKRYLLISTITLIIILATAKWF